MMVRAYEGKKRLLWTLATSSGNASSLPIWAPGAMDDDNDMSVVLETPPIPSLTTLLPPSINPPRRADLISLKLRLAALLPPEEGQAYWSALVAFCTGKINREELGEVIKKILGYGEALQLHNALLLSILYNTTRPSLPPSSVRHAGWHKRKRDKDIEDRDPKRRKIKAAVMALGKRERADIKLLSIGGKREKAREEEQQGLLSAVLDSKGARAGKDGLPEALADTKAPSATLQEDYMRCLQTPLCSESKLLPDVNTLNDRMSLLAYESGLGGGADSKVAQLGIVALEGHLKNMITSAISLARSRRAANAPPISSSSSLTLANAPPPALNSESETPLSAADFQALFNISPHLLALPHFGAVEKLYALPNLSSDTSSDEESEEEEKRAPSKRPSLSRTKTLSRPASRAGRSGSGSTNTFGRKGREQFVIDPHAVDIPQGHPDVVAHPRLGSLSLPNGNNAVTVNGNGTAANGAMDVDTVPGSTAASRRTSINNGHVQGTRSSMADLSASQGPVSPKSLRNQLFPELAGPTEEPAQLAIPSSPGHNYTTTDGGDTSDDEHKLGQQPRGRGRPANGTGPRDIERAQAQKKKLWEVVDSVALLDGVID